jgi:hypothetical protein
MTITVFSLKSIYLLGGPKVLNTAALIIICVFIALLIVMVRKVYFVAAVLVFAFLAELFNLIYDGQTPLTMLFYFGMHFPLMIYLIKNYDKKVKPFFELPVCVFIMFLVYSFGFWNEQPWHYVAIVAYSILLCVNLALSYGLNNTAFRGMLLVFLVDTIVVWSLVEGGATLIRGLCWLPFMAGIWLFAEGGKKHKELSKEI